MSKPDENPTWTDSHVFAFGLTLLARSKGLQVEDLTDEVGLELGSVVRAQMAETQQVATE